MVRVIVALPTAALLVVVVGLVLILGRCQHNNVDQRRKVCLDCDKTFEHINYLDS